MTFQDFFFDAVGPQPLNFLFGLILIVAFSPEQFARPSIDLSSLPIRFVGELSSLTSHQRYYGAMAFYMLGLLVLYVVLCAMGPEGLKNLGADGDDAALKSFGVDEDSIRLLIALVIIGIIPYFPLINRLEFKYRRACHRLANLPDFALACASRLTELPFDPDSVGKAETAFDREIKNALLLRDQRPDDEIRRHLDAWLAIASLAGRLVWMARNDGDRLFDQKLIGLLKPEISGIEERVQLLHLGLCQQASGEAEAEPSIKLSDLRKRLPLLRNRVNFTVALLVLRGRAKGVSLLDAKQYFGIEAIDTGQEHPQLETAISTASLVVLVTVVLLLLSDYALPAIVQYFEMDHQKFFGAGSANTIFPSLLNACLVNGGVIWAAFAFRNEKQLRNAWLHWEGGVPKGRMPPNYVAAAGICLIGSLLMNYLYRGALESTWHDVLGTVQESAPFSLVHVFVGLIFLWNLDFMRLKRPLPSIGRRFRYVLFQALLVALVGAVMGLFYTLRTPTPHIQILFSAFASFAACLVVSTVTLLVVQPRDLPAPGDPVKGAALTA